MATNDNRHSRFVARAKVILPLAALGLLSTLFLFYKGTVDPSNNIVYSNIDISDLANDETIGAPEYAGVTRDGAAIVIRAQNIAPSATTTSARSLLTRVSFPDGMTMDIRAHNGELVAPKNRVEMTGGVILQTSSGYVVQTTEIHASLAETDILMPHSVTSVGPLGQVDAGSARLSGAEGSYVLVFKGGVKMLYDPRN